MAVERLAERRLRRGEPNSERLVAFQDELGEPRAQHAHAVEHDERLVVRERRNGRVGAIAVGHGFGQAPRGAGGARLARHAPGPTCPRWRRQWSASTIAIMASPTGTARMPTQGSWRPLVEISVSCAEPVDGAPGGEDRRGRLHGEADDDRLAGRDAAQDAAGVVGQELRPPVVAHADLVGVVLAGQLRRRHAGPDLDALHGVDAHHGTGEVLVELAVDRRAPSGRRALGHDLDHRAHGGAGLAHLVQVARPRLDDTGVRARRTDCCRPPPNSSATGRSCAGRSAPARRGS